MTFLFLGLDGLDYEFVERFDCFDFSDDKNIPIEFEHLDQNLKEVQGEKGEQEALYGHWTFYVWGAIASGQLETPQMRQEHPLPENVEFPLKLDYISENRKSVWNWFKGRLKRRPRFKSFVFDEFENVKVINFPLSLPEYTRNTALFKDDATSRDYGSKELEMLAAEINDALDKNFDAVFAVTRNVDCVCHGATSPGNFGSSDYDELMQSVVGKGFDEWHEHGMDASEYMTERQVSEADGNKDGKDALIDAVTDHVERTYRKNEEFVRSLNWEDVDNHVVVSDHGFDKLGAGSVKAHGRHAVLSSDFCRYRKMSNFVLNWRNDLREAVESVDDSDQVFEGQSQEEKVKEELEKLGYV